ncbi:hypothetical protein, partial [Morganella morganii]|uniref:hypothetical protein n=1 Tax=Morganella morganii TaxID=582 RepID=UPI0034D5DC46
FIIWQRMAVGLMAGLRKVSCPRQNHNNPSQSLLTERALPIGETIWLLRVSIIHQGFTMMF